MKILDRTCERHPLSDEAVRAELSKPGRTRVLWRCPDCRKHWVAVGGSGSMQAYRAVHIPFFGWQRAA